MYTIKYNIRRRLKMYFKTTPHISVLPSSSETSLVHIRVSGKADRPTDVKLRPQINIATALDKSGSMNGEPLAKAKEAEKFLVKNLTDKDTFTLISFDDTSCIEYPIGYVNSKEKINQIIDKIQIGGCTNIGDALLDCFSQLSSLSTKEVNSINRVLLLSDGQVNSGLRGKTLLDRIAKEVKTRGFTLSTFGLGTSYDKVLLSELAEVGNGSFYHIVNSDDIPKYYAEEFGDILDIALMKAKLSVKTSDGIKINKIYGYDMNSGKWDIGAFYSDETRDLLLEIEIPQNISNPNISVCLVAESPMGGVLEQIDTISFMYGTDDESKASESLEICKFADEITQAFKIQEANKLRDAGDFEGAKTVFYSPMHTHNAWNIYRDAGIIEEKDYLFNSGWQNATAALYECNSFDEARMTGAANNEFVGAMSYSVGAATLSGRKAKTASRRAEIKI